jgi:L-threonylcarbamoyladenylate synthase
VKAVKLDPFDPREDLVERVAALLEDGGVAAFPTDTVYGLGCSGENDRALSRLRELKGGRKSPFIVLIGDQKWLDGLAREVTPLARKLIEGHWPGALTLVLDAAPGVNEGIKSAEGTVAVRLPGSRFCLALCRALNEPIASTSANRAGGLPALNCGEVLSAFEGALDLVVDGGPAPTGLPSTLVDARGERPVVLRSGAVSLE